MEPLPGEPDRRWTPHALGPNRLDKFDQHGGHRGSHEQFKLPSLNPHWPGSNRLERRDY